MYQINRNTATICGVSGGQLHPSPGTWWDFDKSTRKKEGIPPPDITDLLSPTFLGHRPRFPREFPPVLSVQMKGYKHDWFTVTLMAHNTSNWPTEHSPLPPQITHSGKKKGSHQSSKSLSVCYIVDKLQKSYLIARRTKAFNKSTIYTPIPGPLLRWNSSCIHTREHFQARAL